MNRMKLSILAAAIFAALAVSALGATAASAVPFALTENECGAGLPAFCYENETNKKLFEFSGTEELLGSQESAEPHLLLGNLGEAIRIECSAGTFTAAANQPEPLVKAATVTGAFIKFTGCTITETPALVKKCKIKEELVETKSLKGELTNEDPVKIDFTPTEGETAAFAGIIFENNGTETCPATVKGEKQVKGLQLCELLEPTVDALVKLLQCTPTGSALIFGGNAAEFDAEFEVDLKNVTTDKWTVELA